MSSLRHPSRFQCEDQLDTVRRLLGWTTPEFSRKIRAGSSSLNDLVAGEFVLFNSYITCGLAPPISSSFLLLLEEFGLQLQHLTPHSVLLVAIFAHFMEMFVGVRLCSLQAFLLPGRDKEEQARDRRLLFPASAWDVQLLHQRLLQHQVGGLAR
jgi:hypothetical protein